MKAPKKNKAREFEHLVPVNGTTLDVWELIVSKDLLDKVDH